jgi:glycerol kinase
LAEAADPHQDVILVPAFVGFGAPYWNPDSRGAAFGLTRATGPAEMAKAALESVGYQTRDLLEAMSADWQATGVQSTLRVDGGMSASNWAMQFLSDIIAAPVDRPVIQETTALGVAWLAGMYAGLYPDQDEFAASWVRETQFTPKMDSTLRAAKYESWQKAVQATMSF